MPFHGGSLMTFENKSSEGHMSHADAIPFPAGSSSSPLTSVLEQLAPDICRILAGPRGDGVMTPLRTLLTRLAEAFGADDACMHVQRTGTLSPAHIATSERARRLAGSLLEGRWFARQLDEGTPLVLRRGAIDMPSEADHERQCIRAAGVHAVVACSVTTETGATGYMTIFSRRPLTQWIAPALDQLQMVSTLFARAAIWSSA